MRHKRTDKTPRGVVFSAQCCATAVLTGLLLGLMTGGCAPHIEKTSGGDTTPPADTTPATTAQVSDSTTTPALPPPPATLPVTQWEGHAFAVLPLSPTFSRFGYELYPTAALGEATGTPDPQRQLPNHRFRYELLVGRTLVVERVEAAGAEFLLQFRAEDDSLVVFGKTHNQALKGLALRADLAAARSRWEGQVVYARNRQINTYDSTRGKMGSISVSLRDPLRVTEVRWGVGPLPPQPLWLMVSTPDSQRGFIPAQISWTNVLAEKVRAYPAWTDFLLEFDPRTSYSWPEEMWAEIDAHTLATGMTTAQVRLSWGEPAARDTLATAPARVHWTYPGQRLLFESDTLRSSTPR